MKIHRSESDGWSSDADERCLAGGEPAEPLCWGSHDDGTNNASVALSGPGGAPLGRELGGPRGPAGRHPLMRGDAPFSQCLPGAADALASLMGETGSDTASLVRFEDGDLVMKAIVGTSLLGVGARLPIESSTAFLAASEGRLHGAPNLAALEGFDRALDHVTVAAGFRAGCTVPLTLGTARVGAVALHSRRDGWDHTMAIQRISAVAHRLVIEMCHADTRVSSRLLIGHDDSLAAEGLARIGELELGLRTTVIKGSVGELVEHVDAPSDLLVIDCYVGGERIEEQLRILAAAHAVPRVLVVASRDTPANRAAAARAGVAGYCARDASRDTISEAFLLAASGHRTPPVIGDHEEPGLPLTAREREVLVLLDRGLQVKQIARLLRIAPSTVKGYVRNIFVKLDVHSNTAALYVARAEGILDSARTASARAAARTSLIAPAGRDCGEIVDVV